MQPERLAQAAARDVSRETWLLIEHYVALLLEDNQRQNLISRSTEEQIFERHIVDSAQLLPVAAKDNASWVDIGTGPGLPGIVLALLAPHAQYTLVEPRPLRVRFLKRVVDELRLEAHVKVVEGKVDDVKGVFDVITGRAVANLAKFLRISHHLSTENSIWVLPKGRKAAEELEEARRIWHLDAQIVPSKTDDAAAILRLERVRGKHRGGRR